MRLPPRIEPPAQPPAVPNAARARPGLRLGRSLPLLMAAAALAIPATALAAGGGHHPAASRAAAGSVMRTNGSGDKDVPGRANDPSAPRHNHDNGIGNDCDPGLGGSNRDTGNDGRYGEGDTTCQHATGQVLSSHATTSSPHQGPALGGGVEAAASTRVGVGAGMASGGVGAGAGSGVGSSLAQGVGLAQTGSRLPLAGALGALLTLFGGLLLRRRRLAVARA